MQNNENIKGGVERHHSKNNSIGMRFGAILGVVIFVLIVLFCWFADMGNDFSQEYLVEGNQYSIIASTTWSIVYFLSVLLFAGFSLWHLIGLLSKMLVHQHELSLLELRFTQEKEWREIDKLKQERDDFEAKNKELEDKCEGMSAGKDALDREQQIMAMYLLTLYNAKKTSPDMNTSLDVNITSDEVKKILDESIESCKVIKNKIAEIKDKGL